MRKPGPGRPRKPEDERLSEVIQFRVTKKEADHIQRSAIRAGQSVNEYLRSKIARIAQ